MSEPLSGPPRVQVTFSQRLPVPKGAPPIEHYELWLCQECGCVVWGDQKEVHAHAMHGYRQGDPTWGDER